MICAACHAADLYYDWQVSLYGWLVKLGQWLGE